MNSFYISENSADMQAVFTDMVTGDYVMNMFNEDKCLMVQVKPLYETS